eukprot:1160413-Pelagomonas_calceolata.AAC.2
MAREFPYDTATHIYAQSFPALVFSILCTHLFWLNAYTLKRAYSSTLTAWLKARRHKQHVGCSRQPEGQRGDTEAFFFKNNGKMKHECLHCCRPEGWTGDSNKDAWKTCQGCRRASFQSHITATHCPNGIPCLSCDIAAEKAKPLSQAITIVVVATMRFPFSDRSFSKASAALLLFWDIASLSSVLTTAATAGAPKTFTDYRPPKQ